MASHRRLIIVVDGFAGLTPHWPKILPEYIDKIVRRFHHKSREQGTNNVTCELGLVMYNANSELGFDLQSINWTKDIDSFLGILSSLAFNGDHISQYAMAEGLAEALMMYSRPLNGTTEDNYNDGEKHCILVAAGDPVPLKMTVTVPMIQDGKFVVGRLLHNFKADFLELTQMLSQLAVSISVITPNENATFGKIFDLGNNISEMEHALYSYKIDEICVMLSHNFKEAREAIDEKRVQNSPTIRNLQSDGISFSEFFNNNDIQGFGMIPEVADNMHVSLSSSSSFSPVNLYEDIMAELDSFNDNVLLHDKPNTSQFVEDPLSNLFKPDEPLFDNVQHSLRQEQTTSTMNMVSMNALKTVEAEIGKTLEGCSGAQKNNEEVQIAPMVVPKVASTTSRRGNNNAFILDFSTGSSSPAFSPNQNSSTLWSTTQTQKSGDVITPNRQGNYGDGFGNVLVPHSTTNSSNNGFQLYMSPSLNVYQGVSNNQVGGLIRAPFSSQCPLQRAHFGYHGVSSTQVGLSRAPFSSQYPLPRVNVHGIGRNTSWVPPISRISHQPTQWDSLLPPPSSVMDLHGYMQTWEGYICGNVQSRNMFFNNAKGFRRTTSSPSMLNNNQWLERLDISFYIPQRAINYTQSMFHYNVEYALFQIIQYTNRDLYNYLVRTNMCAKIALSSQTLILSPTESEFWYVGIIFPGAVIFVEQAEMQSNTRRLWA